MKPISFCAISVLSVALLCATTEGASAGRVQCVRPNLQRQFTINKPYGEVMGSIVEGQLRSLNGNVSLNKEGRIQIEIGRNGQKTKVEVLEQQWERVNVKCNIKHIALEGRAVGTSKLKVAHPTIGEIVVRVKHDMKMGSDSTQITLQLLNEVCYQGARIKGCDGEVTFKKHGRQTLVTTRFMFHAHVCVPRCFPRIVSRIAWSTAYSINCQTQQVVERYICEAATKYKGGKMAVPAILEVLNKGSIIPHEKMDFKEVSASLWKDANGKWQSKSETK